MLFGPIEGRVVAVEILGIQMILRNAEGIAEPLIVNDLPFAKEFDGIPYVGVVAKPQNVVVGGSRLLLCYYHVFATKLSLAKVRKFLILQGFAALLELSIFQKFQ